MVNINFPGGATATFEAFFDTTNWYAQQTGVGFPDANKDLSGNYPVLITNIGVNGLSGSAKVRLRFGDTDYAEGATVLAGASNGNCSIRIYKNGSNRVYFNRTSSSSTPAVKLYTSSDTLNFTWGGQMAGNWDYALVPTAPTNVQVSVSGISVSVSYTASSSDGDSAITSYVRQYSSSSDNVTFGPWTTFTNGSSLPPGKYYKFRVYSVNAVGNSDAGLSSTIFLSSLLRYTGSAWQAITGTSGSYLKRYDDTPTAGWKDITSIKRYNGSTWDIIDF